VIRKLTFNDHEIVMGFLSDEASINLFIIGDIEAFGYDTDFQELWGEFDEVGQINAVLLRFYSTFIPYAKGEFDLNGFVQIMKKYDSIGTLSGVSEVVEKFENQGITLGEKRVMYFAECKTKEKLGENSLEVKRATIDDVDNIINLRSSIEEFTITPDSKSVLQKSMESNSSRSFYTEDYGTMTACVSTSAENSLSAMIVGVCTHKNFRRKGLATAIMEKLFREILDEGKNLCLFYDNPEAGRIYKRLGFVDIGKWTMYR
jgi:uncharacterized protein